MVADDLGGVLVGADRAVAAPVSYTHLDVYKRQPKRRRALFIIHDAGRKTKGILGRQIAEKGLTGGKKGNKMNIVQFGGRTR